jgi:hypothetical protein
VVYRVLKVKEVYKDLKARRVKWAVSVLKDQ